MKQSEVRYRLVTTLLQATGPLALDELLAQCGLEPDAAGPALRALVEDGQVVAGRLVPGLPAVQYRWAARWEREVGREAGAARQELRAAVAEAGGTGTQALDLGSAPVRAFCRHVLDEYRPPEGKRFLAVLQCSVRRPFSSSPSHASMRRAIRLATGFDPAHDRERCPVHVVVLASRIGPVPYELEEVYPANVGGGGVKHFDGPAFQRAIPILAGRMADYIAAHRGSYDRVATFTEGRYGEVMQACRRIVAERCPDPPAFHVLPVPSGAEVRRIGPSVPRTYWQRFWIQLYLEILAWLPPAAQAEAGARLAKMEVEYVTRDG